MKVSNFAEVGQMRRSRGISMKIMRKELALVGVSWAMEGTGCGMGGEDVQAESAEEDHDADVEEMRDT